MSTTYNHPDCLSLKIKDRTTLDFLIVSWLGAVVQKLSRQLNDHYISQLLQKEADMYFRYLMGNEKVPKCSVIPFTVRYCNFEIYLDWTPVYMNDRLN